MKKLLFISMFAAMIAVGCSKNDILDNSGNIPPAEPYIDPENLIIYYTSSDEEIVEPYSGTWAVEFPFGEGVEIVSNTYEDGIGIIKFSAPVTTIEYGAFYNCSRLTSITIPDSVTTIDVGAFYNCQSLTSITIPDSVTTIGDWAFSYCSSLTSVTIGNSVTTIEYRAFYNCSRLTSITIPDSVTTIGVEAFYNCQSLTSITIPDSVTTIGEMAFRGCISLTSVTIGKGIKTIGDNAFWQCGNSNTILYFHYILDIVPSSNIFNGFNGKIYVPFKDLGDCKTVWRTYFDIDRIEGYDF